MQNLNLFELFEKNKPKKLINIIDLKPINNLKIIFREIRDYFAGNVTGITRDEAIAQNIMRLLFCKIYDERNSESITEFSNRPDENNKIFKSRIDNLFEKVKTTYPDIFEKNEKIEIKADDLSFIVSKLEDYSVLNADRDVIGDAFEELIGTSFRGGEGQFFTPRNVVQMMIDVLQPDEGESVIDPACGSGGFLSYTIRYLLSNNKRKFYVTGIDKDAFLAKIAKIYLSLIGNETEFGVSPKFRSKQSSAKLNFTRKQGAFKSEAVNFHIYCENSLGNPLKWNKKIQVNIKLGNFDVVMTNPPFGAKIPVVGAELLEQYKLGYKWENGGKWTVSNKVLDKQSPQILFIERCLQLLREGGRLGIVLPDGIFGNPSDKYIWEYISGIASVIGVVSLSQETFQPSTHTKTSVLFLKKTTARPKSIFMAIANNVGHNKNGNPSYKINKNGNMILDNYGNKILKDDLPIIAKNFNTHNNNIQRVNEDHLGFTVAYEDLNDHIFIPEYYNPEIERELKSLKDKGKHRLISVGDLIDKDILQIKRGNEIGSQFYGSGEIPFVRTSDIVNWEIKFDPIKAVSEEIYNQYKELQDIREKDILFVNDGTFLIGRTAMITKLDLKIIIQSHLRRIRVLNPKVIDSYYLFYLLNSKIVRKQIDSRIFVQATISTIGNRLNEIILPVCNDENEVKKIIEEVKNIIEEKARLREKTVKIVEGSV